MKYSKGLGRVFGLHWYWLTSHGDKRASRSPIGRRHLIVAAASG